jgi:phosphate acetyltransferase
VVALELATAAVAHRCGLGVGPESTAVAHSCDEFSLEGAVKAANLKLCIPILVRPDARASARAARTASDLGR